METPLLFPDMDGLDTASDKTVCIWLVEDDTPYRQTINYLVNRVSGMRCTQAFADGEGALSALQGLHASARPQVVLMDVNLPGMSGIECLARMKAFAPEVKIVVITIRDDEETIFEAFRKGASGYLLKNASVDTIFSAIWEARSGGMLMAAPVARMVLQFFRQQDPHRNDYGLTERECEVLQKMTEGYSQKEIAEQLFVSLSTVNGHIQHIYDKLHVHSSSAAVAKAIRERLV